MKDIENWDLLAKYFSDECSSQEKRVVEEWLNNNPCQKEDFEHLSKIWRTPDQNSWIIDSINANIDNEWGQLLKQMRMVDAHETQKKGSKKNNNLYIKFSKKNFTPLRHFIRIAAVLMIMMGGGVFLASLFYHIDDYSGESPFREISTGISQLANLELSDGSKLNLSVESKLRLSNKFNQENRQMYLYGQAKFDVISNPAKPFIVETNHAVISVVGTNFTIRAYPDEKFVEVNVMSGSVAVKARNSDEKDAKLLEAGKVGILDTVTGILTVNDIKNDNFLKWKDGKIVFDNATISEVCRDLGRWFGIKFVVEDEELASSVQRLTAVFESRSLNHILAVISYTLDIQATRYDETVVFSKRNMDFD
jgi:transmembrane sensor